MAHTESIAVLSQSNNDYFTLQEIAEQCGVTYAAIRGYAERDCVKTFMGAYVHPSSKGVRWPLDCLQRWQLLMDTAQKGLIRPATVEAWLANIELSPSIAPLTQQDNRGESEALALIPSLGNEAVSLLRNIDSMDTQVIALLRQLVNQMAPPDDCLLDAQESATILSCKPASVRRYVRPVRRGRWRRSDVLRYIQQLNQIG